MGKKRIVPISGERILTIHWELVRLFYEEGDPISPPGPRNEHLVHSSAGRPETGLGEKEKYPSLDAKAAALFHSLVRNHPFHNGNKRTALASTIIFLDSNNYRLTATDDELFSFVLDVANRAKPFDGTDDEAVRAIELWFRQRISRGHHQASDMLVNDFLARCRAAGVRCRKSKSGQLWVLMGTNDRRLSFEVETRSLPGNVVKRYLHLLNLSQTATGISFDEFSEGLSPEQQIIRRYRQVFRRLANV